MTVSHPLQARDFFLFCRAAASFADELSRRNGTLCHLVQRGFLLLVACAWSLCSAADLWIPERVANGVYVLHGTGGEVDRANGGRVANAAFVVGPRGVAVVDTGISFRDGEAIIAAVRSVSARPIRLVVLTHPAQEAIFGAAAFQDRGIPVLAHRAAAALIAGRCEGCLARLRETLGEDAMQSTRVVTPDRLLDRDQTLAAIGRPLRVLAAPASSAPGAIAILDEQTSTLLSGTMAFVQRVPDLRDADVPGWRTALRGLQATHCRQLVPAYGPVGSCVHIGDVGRYFDALEGRMRELLRARVGLVDLAAHGELPRFAAWDGYASFHPGNASRTYLRLEREFFE